MITNNKKTDIDITNEINDYTPSIAVHLSGLLQLPDEYVYLIY